MLRGMRRVALAPMAWLSACATFPPAPAAPAGPSVPALFAPFVGSFRGELRVFGARGRQTVPMTLVVEPVAGAADRVRFVLGYGDADRRDYQLVLDDAATGRCHVDERNGIVLASWLCDGELVSAFTVMGWTNVARYRVVPSGVEFALEALEAGRGEATGGSGEPVLSHGSLARQRALLLRGAD